MGRKVSEDEVEEWVALREKKYTYEAIGKQYGRNPKTVGEHVREYLRKHPKGGQGSPLPDSELETLNRENKRLEAWMELQTLKQKMLKVPNRLDDVEKTLKAYGEDVERLRLKLKSQPDLSKLRCPKCGDYMVVDVTCVSCNHKYCFGLWAGGK